MFVAEKQRGAYLNGHKLSVPGSPSFSQSPGTGFPYDIREDKNTTSTILQNGPEVQAIRRAGSAALDLAYVAAGRFDGFWN